MLQKSFSVHIPWYSNLLPLLLPNKIIQKANGSALIGPLSSSSAEETTLRGESSCLSAPLRAIYLLAVFMLMDGLSYMLSRILQSQPGCFRSASHDLSSSNKLIPAGLHGSWQDSEREKVWKFSQELGPAQVQHHGQHNLSPKASYEKAKMKGGEKEAPVLKWGVVKART